MDGGRSEKSLNILTKRFVGLLLSSKHGILDLKTVSQIFRAYHTGRVCHRHFLVVVVGVVVGGIFRKIYFVFQRECVFSNIGIVIFFSI